MNSLCEVALWWSVKMPNKLTCVLGQDLLTIELVKYQDGSIQT